MIERPTRKNMTLLHLLLLSLLASHGLQEALSFTPPRGSSTISGGKSRTSGTTTTSSSSTSLFGLRSTLVEIRNSLLSRDRTDSELKDGIAFFYDRSSKLWEDVWGEHMHHGYYVPENRTDHVQAQIDLIDEVLKWAGVPESGENTPKKVVDVGCGIGGSSRHIVKKYEGCTAQGITLSPYQANRGNELAKEQGLAERASFQVNSLLFCNIYGMYVSTLTSPSHTHISPQ
jgi:tocopherol O-methyltransferase